MSTGRVVPTGVETENVVPALSIGPAVSALGGGCGGF